MRQLIRIFSHMRQRNARHFSELRDTVTRDNLMNLRRAAIGFEIFLVVYGLWTLWVFQLPMLTGFYVLFLVLNTVLLIAAIRHERRQTPPAFRPVQVMCMSFVILLVSYAICVSTFPFPDRPSIFFPLAYAMAVILFQFPCCQLALTLTGLTAAFIFLIFTWKTPSTYRYEFTTAITTWLLGFFVIFTINDLHLRNGEARLELDHQSQTDPLTNLPNRRGMNCFLSAAYQRCVNLQLPMTVMILDVDHFKRLNDHFGHSEGDRCLATLAGKLSDYTRETGFFVARYGGEEFVVLLPGCSEKDAALTARSLIQRLAFPGPDGKPVTVSLGVAVAVPQPGSTFSELLDRADSALYRAKRAGRNQFAMDLWDADPASCS